MTNTFIILDALNTFFRSRHAVKGDSHTKAGMALHIVFNSIKKAWNDFDGSHIVICLEGRSWRKDFYPPYKRNRAEAKEKLSQEDLEEDKLFFELFDNFSKFVKENTNCTVLQHSELEADDLIAGWIQNHPNDNHVIVSSDSDFVQLISDNVSQYNGVSNTIITKDGYFNDNWKPVIDKKTKLPKPKPDPNWLLFEKCMRGDSTDNVFSAYPGVRKKGSKNKVGLLEAFEDFDSKGYNWNNLMLQRWTDHNGEEHRVLNDYNRNVTLIDLSAQPEHIREKIDQTIVDALLDRKKVSQIGSKLLKFCSVWELNRVIDNITLYTPQYSSEYPYLKEIMKETV